jgi:hypothetical protein
MVGELFDAIVSWQAFLVALLVFGFAPGALLRLFVLAFRRDDPRRRELLSELHAVPRLERPFWVFEQLEVALFEGLWQRVAGRTVRYFAPFLLLRRTSGRWAVVCPQGHIAAKSVTAREMLLPTPGIKSRKPPRYCRRDGSPVVDKCLKCGSRILSTMQGNAWRAVGSCWQCGEPHLWATRKE